MFISNKFFKAVRRVVLSIMLAGLIWMGGLSVASVQALPSVHNASGPNGGDQTTTFDQNRSPNIRSDSRDYVQGTQSSTDSAAKDLDSVGKSVGKRVERALDNIGDNPVGRAVEGLGNAIERSSN